MRFMATDAEAQKLGTFRRVDFFVQNFPDDKKVNKLKVLSTIVSKLIFAAKVHNWNIKGEQNKNEATKNFEML